MKLGVSINLFNGEELLESCVKNIRPFADKIVVVFQTVSNFGTHENKNVELLVHRMKEEGLIDCYIFHTPSQDFEGLDEETKTLITSMRNNFHGVNYDESVYYGVYNELSKRNKGLEYLRSEGCTHVMDMDTDEFYKHDQLTEALKEVDEGGYDAGFAQMRTFYRFANCELTPPETYYVPFIYKIKPTSVFEQVDNKDFPVMTDGKRRIRTRYPIIFGRDELEMYHYSYVRADRESMYSKFQNCSSRMNFTNDKIEKMVNYWENYKAGDQLMFNGDGHDVRMWDCKIVEPSFDIKFSKL